MLEEDWYTEISTAADENADSVIPQMRIISITDADKLCLMKPYCQMMEINVLIMIIRIIIILWWMFTDETSIIITNE